MTVDDITSIAGILANGLASFWWFRSSRVRIPMPGGTVIDANETNNPAAYRRAFENNARLNRFAALASGTAALAMAAQLATKWAGYSSTVV